jgi:hypothetical protein
MKESNKVKFDQAHRSKQVRIHWRPPHSFVANLGGTPFPFDDSVKIKKILPKKATKRKNSKRLLKVAKNHEKKGKNRSKWHVSAIFGRFCYSYDQKVH